MCLQTNPIKRSSIDKLLKCKFIKNSKPISLLVDLLEDNIEINNNDSNTPII